jgi:hypothetical protein
VDAAFQLRRKKPGCEKSGYFIRQYTTPTEEKAKMLTELLKARNFTDLVGLATFERMREKHAALETFKEEVQ